MTASEIRARARQLLGNHIFSSQWINALLLCLICSLISSFASSTGIGTLILTGPLNVGLSAFFLRYSRDREPPKLENSHRAFTDNLGDNIILGLFITLFTLLWSLLFLIPGIVKSYSYSMSFYIKHDHPEYTWQQCMDESQRMMNGHKTRLFLLDLSFIGWILLGSLCLGIGALWISPYMQASHTVFYEELRQF